MTFKRTQSRNWWTCTANGAYNNYLYIHLALTNRWLLVRDGSAYPLEGEAVYLMWETLKNNDHKVELPWYS